MKSPSMCTFSSFSYLIYICKWSYELSYSELEEIFLNWFGVNFVGKSQYIYVCVCVCVCVKGLHRLWHNDRMGMPMKCQGLEFWNPFRMDQNVWNGHAYEVSRTRVLKSVPCGSKCLEFSCQKSTYLFSQILGCTGLYWPIQWIPYSIFMNKVLWTL